jgi:hypothetical protein
MQLPVCSLLTRKVSHYRCWPLPTIALAQPPPASWTESVPHTHRGAQRGRAHLQHRRGVAAGLEAAGRCAAQQQNVLQGVCLERRQLQASDNLTLGQALGQSHSPPRVSAPVTHVPLNSRGYIHGPRN